MVAWMNWCIDGWMDESMAGLLHGCFDGLKMNKCMLEKLYQKMDECMG
jgi:hypothetical protein